MQSLQLLGLCEGAPLTQMQDYLGHAALPVVMEAQDAVQAALSLTPDMLSVLRPKIDAFLSVFRRNLKPDPLQMADAVSELITEQHGEEAAAEDEEAEEEEASVAHAPAPSAAPDE